jgi:hypothetical protein
MIEKENGMQVFNELSENPNTESYVKKFIALLNYQIDTFKRLGHLNSLENSDERDVRKLKK